MTLSQSYSALSRKLYALRGRLSLWLLPASVAALLVTTPFRIADGWILLAVCALLLFLAGWLLRRRRRGKVAAECVVRQSPEEK